MLKDNGYSLQGSSPMLLGKLLGHRRHRTTAGYAHLADGHLVEAADRVGTIIERAMKGDSSIAYQSWDRRTVHK